MVEFVPYDDKIHRSQYLEMNVEYITWIRNEVYNRLGIDLFEGRPSVREYVESVLPEFIEAKPPEGIIYILEVDGKMGGMGALRRLEDGVAEIKRMYVRPEHRGHGYGREMLNKLTEAAEEFGYSTLRLDTGEFMEAALGLYRSAGFKERGPYPGTELTGGLSGQIFMEKKL